MRKNNLRGLVYLVIFAAAMSAFGLGCQNPETPAGYVGYLTQGAVFGKTRYYGVQRGPTSSGLTWMLNVTNVSVTPYTYTEDFTGDNAVLSRDNLRTQFRVHITWRVNPAKVRQFVERYSTLQGGDNADKIVEVAYKNFLREPLRTYARDEIQRYNALDVKDRITPIGETILRRVLTLTRNTPFDVSNVVVGNIQYPTEVANAVSQRLAATQRLEQRRIEVDIERASAAARVVQSEGIAESMRIINQRLSDQYLQHEAIEAQKALAGSPNHTVIYIPSGPNGIPFVNNVGR